MKQSKRFFRFICIGILVSHTFYIQTSQLPAEDGNQLGKALLSSNFVKNIYLYAPKEDPLRVLVRTLWHIFYGQEDDQLLTTRKGPLAIITPEIFAKILDFYKKVGPELDTKFITKLLYEYDLLECYKHYLLLEINNIINIRKYLMNAHKQIKNKIAQIKKQQKETRKKLLETKENFKEIVALSKREKASKINEINRTMGKKSPQKRAAIEKVVQKIDQKYGIPAFKKIKQSYNQEIVTLQEQEKKAEKEKKNIANEMQNKETELKGKRVLLGRDSATTDEITCKIKDLLKKIANAYTSKQYLPGIVDGILWAFYHAKCKTTEALEKPQEESYKAFEAEIKELTPEEQIQKIEENYSLALNSLITQIKSGTFPPHIKLEKFAYEYAPGKATEKFSDCFESSVLDVLSILWYNPVTQQYDDALAPKNLLMNGKNIGYRELKRVLQAVKLADENNIKESGYSKIYKYIDFSSFQELQKKLEAIGLFAPDINNIKLADISAHYILRSPVRQRWVNLISGLKTVQYNQPDNRCEILPRIPNFIALLNFFYGTNAKDIQDFDALLSFENKAQGIKRDVKFETETGERTTIVIDVNLTIKKQHLSYTIRLTLMNHHTVLVCNARDGKEHNMYKKDVATQLAETINVNIDSYHRLTPFLLLLSDEALLEQTIPLTPQLIRSIYYCLGLKCDNTKLAIAKHILHHNLLRYKDIKKLLYKIRENFRNNRDLENRLISYIIQSKAYEANQELDQYLTQKSSQVLEVIANIDISKEQFYTLYHNMLLHEADVNSNWKHKDGILHAVIKHGYLDLAQKLITHKKIDINRTGTLQRTALHIAAINGCLKTIEALLKHKKIEANPLDETHNTPLNLAAKYNKLKTVMFLLEHQKTKIHTKNTPLHACASSDAVSMFRFFLKKKKLNPQAPDFQNNTPLHVASYHGHEQTVDFLVSNTKIPIDINTPGYKHRTALCAAAKNNKPKVVKKLLEQQNIDPNIQDTNKYTPLNRAAKKGYTDIVKELLAHKKTNPNIPNKKQETPLGWAAYYGFVKIVKLLCTYPSTDVNLPDHHGKTPLYWAATKGHLQVVKELLLHKKIDRNRATPDGRTPLNRALFKGHAKIAELLRS